MVDKKNKNILGFSPHQYDTGFTLIEVLLVVAIFVILISGAVSMLSNRVSQDDLVAKSGEIVDIISRAQNYSRTGFRGDVWGIKVLDNDSSCPADTDCLAMFKGDSYTYRDSSYDQYASLNDDNSGVYLDANQEKEFYFYYGSGFLNTSTEQEIVLKSNFGSSKTVRIAPSGLAYLFTCGDDKVFDKEGHGYKTVKIGNQCWMAENLNTGAVLAVDSWPSDNGVVEKWCYEDTASNCDLKGGLYDWDEIMDYGTTSGDKGICPNGWHLPSNAEFSTLIANYPAPSAGTELKVNGSSGFNMIMSGERDDGMSYDSLTSLVVFWTSTEQSAGFAYIKYNDNGATMIHTDNAENWGFSVRCLKDY
jgi:uncharacterized protein (TIGR02145 family)/prepilin-type N-terminal cleavage/methylation domain-containing protein